MESRYVTAFSRNLTVTTTVLLTSIAMAAPPNIVGLSPANGSKDVDAATTAITVTFDQDMGKGMSWTGGGPHYPKIDETKKAGWADSRTCVLAVSLEPAKVYRLGINSTSYQNFRSAAGEPSNPSTVVFATKGASAEDLAVMEAPKVVKFDPENGSKSVEPKVDKISVTFNQPMGGGMSWVGGGDSYPESAGDTKWSEDARTCTKPVKLKAGHSYKIGINSPDYQNFTNATGIPAEPVAYEFTTAPQ